MSIIIPKTWSNCPRQVTPRVGVAWSRTDLLVTEKGSLGNSAWTLQPKGCGNSGYYSHLPLKMFDNNETKNGITILNEWIKLRYGVFPNIGFSNDPVYPEYYKHNNIIKETACYYSNGTTSGIACNTEDSEKCSFDSCKPEGYPPTKHNILCNRETVKSVIFDHVDIRNRESSVFNMPKFQYFCEEKVKFVLALDSSSAMIDRDNWKFIRIAARRFVLYDLPNNTEIGLVRFSAKAKAETDSLTSLSSDKDRESIVARIPDYPEKMAEKCFECAIRESIKLFEKDGGSAFGNVVLLITSGTANINDLNAAINLARNKQMKITVISYAATSENQHQLASETGGFTEIVPSKGVGSSSHLSMMIRLGDALLSSVQRHLGSSEEFGDLPVQVHEMEYQDTATSIVNGTFVLDPMLNRDNLFALYFYSRDNPYVKRLWLTSPSGKTFEGKSEYSLSGHYFTPLHGVNTPGLWSYAFERESQSHQSHFVKVFSKPKSKSQATVTGRLLLDKNIFDFSEGSLILLAEVKFGDYPIHDARVRVIVWYNGSESKEIFLIDNGNGDPDITNGDGIYSRYFIPPLETKTDYSFTLVVDHNDGRAYTYREGGDGEGDGPCCGSQIPIYREDRDYLPSFQRISPPQSLRVVNAPILSQIPPNRISDLRARIEEPKAVVEIQWTAPGADFDSGLAKSYDLRYSTSLDDLYDSFDEQPSIALSEAPLAAGSETEYTFRFTHYDKPYYFALRAVDENNNQGKLSNSVEVFIPAPPTTSTSSTTPMPYATDTVSEDDIHLTVGAIAGIAAGGFLAVILIITFSCCAVSRRKEKGKCMKENALKNPTIYTSGQIKTSALKDSSRNNSIDTVDSAAKSVTQPVHWTASQLLTEHERRQTPAGTAHIYPNYRPNPSSDYSYLNESYLQVGSVYSGYQSQQDYGFRNEERYGPYGGGGSPRSGSYSAPSDGFPPPYDNSGDYQKVPPPTLPKPKIILKASPNLQGSVTSLASDRKRRNITQV
ncbi:calcium-activated chloride channel regulator 2-like isoform X2 [Artemia franciscana]